jgi:CRISPR-associated protein Csh1
MNILRLKNSVGGMRDYTERESLIQKAISDLFYRGRLSGQFLTNVPDLKNGEFTAMMQVLYLQGRQAFYDWFYKGTTLSLIPIFANITLRSMEEQLLHIESTRVSHLADAFNLRLSIMLLLDEKGGKKMADQIQSTITSLRMRMVGDEQTYCANDTEFYFLAGQLGYYLVSRSKAASDKKTGELLEPFLRAKDGHQLKKRLEETYLLYKYDIALGYQKFNRAFSMVMGYETDTNLNHAREFLLAGIFADNFFYEKSE